VVQQAVILAGGFGKRLGVLVEKTPKPLLPVGGRPFLDYLIWNLKRQGISRIILSIGYKGKKITEYYNNNPTSDIEIICLQEPRPLGTAGALKYAASELDNEFLVINGDSLFDVDYEILFKYMHNFSETMLVMAVLHVSNAGRYGQVIINDAMVMGFVEKTAIEQSGIINGGVYAMKNQVLNMIPNGNYSLENNLFPSLASKGLLMAKQCDEYFIDIGVPEDFNHAQKELPLWMNKNNINLKR